MTADDHLEAFAEAVLGVPARPEDQALVEDAERSRDDRQRVQPAPPHPGEEEAPQVLDDLDEWKEAPG
jgi:hypothetical protein